MADSADPAPAPAPNAANAPGAVVSNAPHPGVVAAQRARAGRADTIALIEAGKLGDVNAKPAPRAEPAKPPAPAATPAPAGRTPTPADAEPLEPTADPAPDLETTRRLSTIQAAEKRHRDKMAADRADLDAKVKGIERDWAPRVKAAEDFEALRAKAKKGGVHLVAALAALGIGEDDLEPAAQAIYAHSKAGAADPARKAHADRLLREREEITERDATQRRIDELEQRLTQRDQQGEFRSLQANYLDSALDAITDTTPLAKAVVARAKGGTTPAERASAAKRMTALRGKLWDLTVAMTEELDGEAPDPADVIARYEDLRGAELDELGIPRPTATTDDPKKNSQPADKKPPAKTLSADLSTPRVPRDAQSGKDHRAETRRMIESGKLE